MPKIIKTGWGIKLGSRVKNWKRRWFVLLSDGSLRYFEDKITFSEKGYYQIDKNTTFKIACASSEGIPIHLTNKKRIMQINFQTSSEAEEWISGFSSVQGLM
ncbi:PH domain containing protein [Trichomonas vaginalis G3]|uniref:PH domain containing protein n=1 Tax=Trichomonas vaginalis (strain ATCC PRA-98 / G3) TaxID=412133 RepID=A2DYR8_TRIV3|nr:PH domain-like family [Trichomonas vaginalis G3]EAY14458.1 PH domain containing protein [Trichomonas vaginalis G3]KAI5519638.1 PH domain-like family [Trichomonas vaginalis G3]|eukprot:XP_001326681.1 PH domain containing protein [Trichomonas vaginalis G3]